MPASASHAYWNNGVDRGGRGEARVGDGELGREAYGEMGRVRLDSGCEWSFGVDGLGALKEEGRVKFGGRWEGGKRESAR